MAVREQETVAKNNNTDAISAANTKQMSTVPLMDPGRIINVGSVAGFMPQDAPTYAYGVSKWWCIT